MGNFTPWAEQNWFPLVQTLGILGSLIATYIALIRDRKAWKLGNYLTLAGHHRDLWRDAHSNPALDRILTTEADLIAKPITPQEQEFLNLVIVHFHTGWIVAREKVYLPLELLAADAKAFFQLPLPREVWKRNRTFQDPQFARFIEKAAQLTSPKKN